jgi:hypothetical protein
MPTNHAVVAAIPHVGDPVKELLRELIVQRLAYVITTAAEAQDLTAVDPAYGATIVVLILNGKIFTLDPLDTTTAHDGVAVLVSNDGKRYKIEAVAFPYAVLDKDTTAPPGSPSIGDAYLLYGTPSGAWAGHVDDIAIYTARGWEFIEAPIGRFLYVEDEDAYYHLDDNGDWQAGIGSLLYSAGTVPPSALIGGGGLVLWRVENQTTTAPPVSVTDEIAYAIGAGATGAWAGHDAKIAHGENGAWVIYTPAEGWELYDKNLNANYRFNGTAWVSAAGTWVGFSESTLTSGAMSAITGSSVYNYSATVAPAAQQRRYDPMTVSHTAKRAGARLRIRYQASDPVIGSTGGGGTASVAMAMALYRDNETTALDWIVIAAVDGVDIDRILNAEWIIAASDASAHTYKVAFIASSNGTDLHYVESADRRKMTVEEQA